MNNLNIKLHHWQNQIIKKLAMETTLRFSDLIIEGLESEHVNYHIKKLIDYGLLNKSKQGYELTDTGKDYSNLLDDEVDVIEKQPKTSILIYGIRKAKNGVIEHLLSKRLRHPYFGKVGRLTGKVRFGETLQEAVERELFEETGLSAKKIVLERIYHKLRDNPDGQVVQDNLFYQFFVTDFKGTFISKTQYQENMWVSKHDVILNKLDTFETLHLDSRVEPLEFTFEEDRGVVDDF